MSALDSAVAQDSMRAHRLLRCALQLRRQARALQSFSSAPDEAVLAAAQTELDLVSSWRGNVPEAAELTLQDRPSDQPSLWQRAFVDPALYESLTSVVGQGLP